MEKAKFNRTMYCAEPRMSDIGKEVSVCGWAARNRDLGQLIFIDLRDRTGLLQLAFDEGTDRAVFEAASTVRGEFVLHAKGVLRERAAKNPELPTG
ncbi:MAG: OB-fold nucleic acid binding domain-containing protein, partial [Oscillospiraceae bacterium]|nr:OB-fold nucleic acid binding domain-containing protein [Oscillospiraceae bacterium]